MKGGVVITGARLFVFELLFVRLLFVFGLRLFVLGLRFAFVLRSVFALRLFTLRSFALRSLALRLLALRLLALRFELLLLLLFELLLLFVLRLRLLLLLLLAFSLFSFSFFEAEESPPVFLFSVAKLSSAEDGGAETGLSPSLAVARLMTTATVWPTLMISPGCGDWSRIVFGLASGL